MTTIECKLFYLLKDIALHFIVDYIRVIRESGHERRNKELKCVTKNLRKIDYIYVLLYVKKWKKHFLKLSFCFIKIITIYNSTTIL
jgi:hypothetical protein